MNPFRRSPLVIISTILVYIFLYAPILVLMLFSFNASRVNVTFQGFIPEFSDRTVMDGSLVKASPCGPFHWFCELSKNREVVNAARNTLTIAFIATIVSTIIGTMAALALQRYNFRLKPFSQLSLYLHLSGDSRLTLGLGTVIVSHIAFMVPFVTLVVQARLQGFDKSYEEAAMDLGANEWITFRRITFPMILPGVLSGALLAFTLSLDDFVITFFTNGSGSTTLPIYVYGLLRRIITPQVNALSTVWILAVFTVVLLLQVLQNREQKQR